ncbi:uncharacterized protein SAMN05444411_10115 [Lutibacter oricola]|uniref:DUF418 domain-containing protein n=1 Tax=Lutibacter oricola TaxID=762486 RepID=A0A1H2QJ39_9FLAO|nr:DUF418 domain-containing protein [Lutibacter oricola]SDW07095.1 uncharacterized protein SAMN05444411_10115 [Lutibacter oricola]
METLNTKQRLLNVDALRGFALVSIMLLHNLEHFDFFFKPKNLPNWMIQLDQSIWDTTFFLFAGKSYAMFAFLFGVTFFIQMNNQAKRGNDFRLRFVWRLFLLFIFGTINSAFYEGDILTLYAFVGLFLIPFAKLNSKTVLIVAFILFLQPFEIGKLIYYFQHPNIEIGNPQSWTYFGKLKEYIPGDSLLETIKGNLTNGKKAVWIWSWENGRFLHLLSLFILGMVASKKNLFVQTVKNKKFWLRVFIVSIVLFIPLFYIQKYSLGTIESKAIRATFKAIEKSWTNFAFTFVMLSGFLLLFYSKFWQKILNVFSPMGKMSLSNYILQTIIGTTLYYGFGFGLYKYTGATYSLLIGIVSSIALILFSKWWMKNHKRGPLEQIWHNLTWLNSK